MLPIKVKKLRPNAVLPTYGSQEAAGADLYACVEEPITVNPGESVFVPTGLAMPLPAISGAEPWIGSNILGYFPCGLIFPEGEMPMLPSMAEPRSVRISPKRLLATTTSSRSGCMIKNPASASMCICEDSRPGYSDLTSSKIVSQNTIE